MSLEPKKRGRKSIKTPYFGPKEEEAVKRYLELGLIIKDPNTQDGYRWSGTTKEDIERNKIYLNHLKKPLDKMVESIIRKYKLYSKTMDFNDLHADTLGFLHVKFHKFNSNNNKKSYSYYGTVVKHYLLGKLIKEDKKLKQNLDFDDLLPSLEQSQEFIYYIDNESSDLTQLINSILKAVKKEMENKVLTENEHKVGVALVSILENWEKLFSGNNIDGGNKFNKNLILYYIRELTTLTTKDIRNAMKRYKVLYNIVKQESY